MVVPDWPMFAFMLPKQFLRDRPRTTSFQRALEWEDLVIIKMPK
jgi:hypothetical protein